MYAKRPATKVYYIQADLVLWDYTPKATADVRCSILARFLLTFFKLSTTFSNCIQSVVSSNLNS